MSHGPLAALLLLFAAAFLLAARSGPGALASVAAELGLTPESVAIAGLAPTQVSEILRRLGRERVLRTRLEEHHQRAHRAGETVMSLIGRLRASANDELAVEGVKALAILETERKAIQGIRRELRALLLEDLNEVCRTRLAAWRAASLYRVPPAFRVTERAAEEWRAIEAALETETQREQPSNPPDDHDAALLEHVRASTEVQEAERRLREGLSAAARVFGLVEA